MPAQTPVAAPEQWHLSKSVSITQILTIIAMAGGLFVWGGDVEKQIDSNRLAIAHEAQMRALEQNHLAEFKDEIRTRLQRIDDKLDALIERDKR